MRGTAHHVVILAEGRELARHPRHTGARLLLQAQHYDGESTPRVLAPTPLGRRAQLQLAGAAAWTLPRPIARPLDDYIALIEEACR